METALSAKYADSPTIKKTFTIPEALWEDFEKLSELGGRSQLVTTLLNAWIVEQKRARLKAHIDEEHRVMGAAHLKMEKLFAPSLIDGLTPEDAE